MSIAEGRGLVSVLMLSKCGKRSVGGGEAGKKAKTTPDTGGKSVSEKSQGTLTCRNPLKSQDTHTCRKKSQVTYTCRNLFDPHTKMMSICDNKYFLSSWKDEGHAFLSMEFKSFYMEHTQGEVNHEDGQVPKPRALDDHLGVSNTSMDVRPLSTGRPN